MLTALAGLVLALMLLAGLILTALLLLAGFVLTALLRVILLLLGAYVADSAVRWPFLKLSGA